MDRDITQPANSSHRHGQIAERHRVELDAEDPRKDAVAHERWQDFVFGALDIDLQQIHELLQAQDWRHGNIAQLRMVIEEVLFKTPSMTITADDFRTVLEAHGEEGASDTAPVSTETDEKRQAKVTKPPLIITDEDLRRFGIH